MMPVVPLISGVTTEMLEVSGGLVMSAVGEGPVCIQ